MNRHTKAITLSLILALLATISHAATIRVPSEHLTIQAGIDAATDGDTVLVADGPYFGEGNRNISFKGKAITVRSENGPEVTIIHPQRNRGFTFDKGETEVSVLAGFTITSGVADHSGGIFCKASSPRITNCVIEKNTGIGNSPYWESGGIFCDNASPTITNCVITESAGMHFFIQGIISKCY